MKYNIFFSILCICLTVVLTGCSNEHPNGKGSLSTSAPDISSEERAIPEETEIFLNPENGKYGIKKGDSVKAEAIYDKIEDLYGVYCAEITDGTREALVYDANQSPMIEKIPNTIYWLFDMESGNMLVNTAFESVDIYQDASGNPYIQGCLDGTRYVFEYNGEKATLLQKDEPAEESLESGYILFSYYWNWSQSKWGIKSPEGEIILAPLYERVEMPFDYRIIYYDGASARQGLEFGRCNLCKNDGTVLNSSFNAIEYSVFEDGYFGIAVSIGEDAEVLCHETGGSVTPKGCWIVDRDGNTLGERFDKIYINGDETKLCADSPEDVVSFQTGDSITKKTVSEIIILK